MNRSHWRRDFDVMGGGKGSGFGGGGFDMSKLVRACFFLFTNVNLLKTSSPDGCLWI